MRATLRPQDDPTAVAAEHTPDVPASSYRERAIADYLRSHGGSDGLTVTCDPNADTAHIVQDDYEEAPEITIPGRELIVQTHDLRPVVATRLLQYGCALHEHGHDRYTPGPLLKELFDRQTFAQPLDSLYWDLVNALEDARIEAALVAEEGEWAKERLQFTNLNFVQVPVSQTPSPDAITWQTAVTAAAIHYGKANEAFEFIPTLEDASDDTLQWRSERDKHLYCWVIPGLKTALSDVTGEPDGETAVKRMLKFVRSLDRTLNALADDPPRDNRRQRNATSNDTDDQGNDMGSEKEQPDALDGEQDGESDNSDTAPSNEDDSGEAADEDGDGESTAGSEDADGGDSEKNGNGHPGSGDESERPEEQSKSTSDAGGGVDDSAEDSNQEAECAVGEESGQSASDGDNSSKAHRSDDADDNGNTTTTDDDDRDGSTSDSTDEGSAGAKSSGNGGGSESSPTDSSHNEDPEESDGAKPSSEDISGKHDSPDGEPTEQDQFGDGQTTPSLESGEAGGEQSGQPSDAGNDETPANLSQPTDEGESDEAEPISKALLDRESRKSTHEERQVERDEQELADELERLQTALNGGDGDISKLTVADETQHDGSAEVWDRIQSEAGMLKGPLQAALQQTQKTEFQRGTRTGRFDPSMGRRLAVNNLAVNQVDVSGDKKQYSVIVVLDRSGSMSGDIAEAEVAAGGFALALEQLHINVAIVDLYRNNARMVKPFPSHVRDKQDTLTDGNVGGGTPLSDALVVSRERVRQEPNFPFMFVVSDGMPFDTSRYLDELEATDFPVVGVTIGKGTATDFDEYYDVARTATAENIGDELVALATEIMF